MSFGTCYDWLLHVVLIMFSLFVYCYIDYCCALVIDYGYCLIGYGMNCEGTPLFC